MSPERYTLADYHDSDGGFEVFGRAVKELPSATVQFAKEAWENPSETIAHAAKTTLEAGAVGTAIGYLVPARGPASMLVGVALTAPLVYKAGKRLNGAYNESLNPLADQQAIAKLLARDTVHGTYDLSLGLAGGYAGAEVGYAMAGSRGVFGRVGQATQRGILKAENKGMAFLRGVSEGKPGISPGPGSGLMRPPKIDIYSSVPQGSSASKILNDHPIPEPIATALVPDLKPTIAPEKLPFGRRTLGILNRRVDQFLTSPQQSGYNIYLGSLHGHSRYSDGMGLPRDIYAKAKQEGYDFTAITDHNHTAARGGVKPDDVRAHDQAGTPTVAEDPTLYTRTIADAKAATEPGKFVAIVGLELGTIGKVGGGHNHQDFLGPDVLTGSSTRNITPSRSGEVKLNEPKVLEGPAGKNSNPATDSATSATGKPGESQTAAPSAQRGDGARQPTPNPKLPTPREVTGPVGKLPPDQPHTTLGERPADMSSRGSLSAELGKATSGKSKGGVNHINLFEMGEFVQSVRERGLVGYVVNLFRGKDTGPIVTQPEVVKFNDGDYKALANYLSGVTDSTGGTPVIQFNHPRFKADESPNLARGDRARDYGQKSFKSRQQWLDEFVDPYVRQIEVITGGALKKDPVEVVSPEHIDPTSFAGYLDKGVHASPTFGRDFHYGDPGGNPGATGIMAKNLDKKSLMDALRDRRTIATTNGEKLTATMWGNDKHPMGSILDQAVAPELTLSVRVGGEVVPDAQYKVKLWGDTKLGDKKLAEVMQETTVSGKDLLASDNKVSFDPLQHILGRRSAYYVEIQRTDPATGHVDRMFTAPIWVEPLTGSKHSLMMRWLSGNSAIYMEGLARGK